MPKDLDNNVMYEIIIILLLEGEKRGGQYFHFHCHDIIIDCEEYCSLW